MFRPFRKYQITNEMKCYILQSIHKSLDKSLDKCKINKNNHHMLPLTNSLDFDTFEIKNSTIMTNILNSFHSFCQLAKPLFRFIKALFYFKIPSSNQTLSKK